MTRSIALKLIVSCALITWLFWRTPMGEIAATLGSLKPVSAFGALVLTLVAWWLSALRLWCIAPQFRLRAVVQMTFVALFYGTVLPGQVAGDVMKAHRLRKTQAEPGQAVATTLVDRVVATFALFILGACATTLVKEAPIELTLLFAAAAMVLFVGTMILAQARAHAFMMRWMRSEQPGRLMVSLGRFVDAMHRILQHPRRLLACFLLALIFHGLCTAIQIELAHAIGFELPATVWLLVYSGVALLLLLPISVAGLGLREGGYVGLLGIFGVPASQALALSLMLFAYTLLGALLGWVADVIDQDER